MDVFQGYPATHTFTQQTFLPGPTDGNYAWRVFSINFASTVSTAHLTLCGGAASTATALTTGPYVKINTDSQGVGTFESSCGVRIIKSALCHTSASFSFGSVCYVLERV